MFEASYSVRVYTFTIDPRSAPLVSRLIAFASGSIASGEIPLGLFEDQVKLARAFERTGEGINSDTHVPKPLYEKVHTLARLLVAQTARKLQGENTRFSGGVSEAQPAEGAASFEPCTAAVGSLEEFARSSFVVPPIFVRALVTRACSNATTQQLRALRTKMIDQPLCFILGSTPDDKLLVWERDNITIMSVDGVRKSLPGPYAEFESLLLKKFAFRAESNTCVDTTLVSFHGYLLFECRKEVVCCMKSPSVPNNDGSRVDDLIRYPPPCHGKAGTYYGHQEFKDAKMHWLGLELIQSLANSNNGSSNSQWDHKRYAWELFVARDLHARHILSGNRDPVVPFQLDPRYNSSNAFKHAFRVNEKEWAVSMLGPDRSHARSLTDTAQRLYARRVLRLLLPDYKFPKQGNSASISSEDLTSQRTFECACAQCSTRLRFKITINPTATTIVKTKCASCGAELKINIPPPSALAPASGEEGSVVHSPAGFVVHGHEGAVVHGWDEALHGEEAVTTAGVGCSGAGVSDRNGPSDRVSLQCQSLVHDIGSSWDGEAPEGDDVVVDGDDDDNDDDAVVEGTQTQECTQTQTRGGADGLPESAPIRFATNTRDSDIEARFGDDQTALSGAGSSGDVGDLLDDNTMAGCSSTAPDGLVGGTLHTARHLEASNFLSVLFDNHNNHEDTMPAGPSTALDAWAGSNSLASDARGSTATETRYAFRSNVRDVNYSDGHSRINHSMVTDDSNRSYILADGVASEIEPLDGVDRFAAMIDREVEVNPSGPGSSGNPINPASLSADIDNNALAADPSAAHNSMFDDNVPKKSPARFSSFLGGGRIVADKG